MMGGTPATQEAGVRFSWAGVLVACALGQSALALETVTVNVMGIDDANRAAATRDPQRCL